MRSFVKGQAFACIGQQTVIDLASMTGNITPENCISHPKKYFVYTKRVIFRNFLSSSECNRGKRLYDVPLEQDIMGLFTRIEPALNPEIIDKFRLDLVEQGNSSGAIWHGCTPPPDSA